MRAWQASAAGLCTAAALTLSLPPLRSLIEQSMVWHMAVQMPLLMVAGALFGVSCGASCEAIRLPALSWLRSCNFYGLSGFMLTLCVSAFWMLPTSIDRAVVLPAVDAAKLATLWLAGLALQRSWQPAPAAVHLFFAGFALPMMLWLGLYMASADLRLCNAYTLASQQQAGQALVLWAGAAAMFWAAAWARRSARAVAVSRRVTVHAAPPSPTTPHRGRAGRRRQTLPASQRSAARQKW